MKFNESKIQTRFKLCMFVIQIVAWARREGLRFPYATKMFNNVSNIMYSDKTKNKLVM